MAADDTAYETITDGFGKSVRIKSIPKWNRTVYSAKAPSPPKVVVTTPKKKPPPEIKPVVAEIKVVEKVKEVPVIVPSSILPDSLDALVAMVKANRKAREEVLVAECPKCRHRFGLVSDGTDYKVIDHGVVSFPCEKHR